MACTKNFAVGDTVTLINETTFPNGTTIEAGTSGTIEGKHPMSCSYDVRFKGTLFQFVHESEIK